MEALNLRSGAIYPASLINSSHKWFEKELRSLDESLVLYFNFKKKRWEIYYENKNFKYLPFHVLTIETPNKNYREPDSGILAYLRQIDTWKIRNFPHYMDGIEEQNKKLFNLELR